MNHDDTDTAKGRKIAHEEQVEHIEKDANQSLEELIEQAFQHKHKTTYPSYFPIISIVRAELRYSNGGSERL